MRILTKMINKRSLLFFIAGFLLFAAPKWVQIRIESTTANASACASTIDVFCTGSADGPALQTAMNCPGSVVRPHGTCDVNQGLVGTNIGYEGADATLNVEPSVTPGVTLVTGANAYSSKPWSHLRMTGSSATGLLLEGNFTHLDQPSISG